MKFVLVTIKYLHRLFFHDGAASRSGRFNDVQAHIRKNNDITIYVHCASHSLNLAISDVCDFQNIKNCLEVLGTVFQIRVKT